MVINLLIIGLSEANDIQSISPPRKKRKKSQSLVLVTINMSCTNGVSK